MAGADHPTSPQSPFDADELFRRFVETGSPDLFGELYRKLHGFVYRVCLSALGNRHDAEEAAQETFLVLWRKRKRLKPGNVRALLTKTARYAASEKIRKRHVKLLPDEGLDESAGPTHPDPADKEESQRLAERIWEAVSELSPADQELLTAHYKRGSGISVIAREHNASTHAITQRLLRARRRVVARIGESPAGRA